MPIQCGADLVQKLCDFLGDVWATRLLRAVAIAQPRTVQQLGPAVCTVAICGRVSLTPARSSSGSHTGALQNGVSFELSGKGVPSRTNNATCGHNCGASGD